ncbi:MAG: hypothetical protein LLG09_02515 [Negativicutes bacterium]|nr:hypothetical protein [Negativicutes bacterium]
MASYRQKEINLYRRYQQNVKHSYSKWLIYAVSVAAILIFCFAWDGWLDWRCAGLSREISETQTYLADPANLLAKETSQTVHSQLAAVNTEAKKLSKAFAALQSYPRMNSMLLREIETCGGETISIFITGYQALSGQLEYLAVSGQVIDIPAYINNLEQSNLFTGVSYTGYDYNKEKYFYRINVSFFLSETAGKGMVQ